MKCEGNNLYLSVRKMPVYLKCVFFYTYKNDDERAAELFSDGGVEVAGFSLPHESLIGDPISTNP